MTIAMHMVKLCAVQCMAVNGVKQWVDNEAKVRCREGSIEVDVKTVGLTWTNDSGS